MRGSIRGWWIQIAVRRKRETSKDHSLSCCTSSPIMSLSIFIVNLCAVPRGHIDPGGCYRTRIQLSPTQLSSNKDVSGEPVTLLPPPVSLAPPTLLVWAIMKCSLCWGLALCYPSAGTKPALPCPVILWKENVIWSRFRCRHSVY